MKGMKFWVGMAIALSALLSSCMGGPSGSVSLSVAALSDADVARVEVTITGSGISPPIVQELSRAGDEWRGAIGGIPAGTDRTFTVVAYDAMGNAIFTGDAMGVTVVGDDTVTVVIVLQDATMHTPGMENPPDIDSVTVVPGILAPGDVASLSVVASDVDPGDTLTYAWTGAGGTFVDATAANTSWVAPATEGTYTLTITVTDNHGSGRSVSVDVLVTAAANVGTARLEVTVNSWPVITRFAIDPGLVQANGTANVLVTASDPDGDTLSYTYDTAGCGSVASLVYTAPATQPHTCIVTLTVDDGHMGHATATATVYVDDEITANHAPVIGTTFQSNWVAGPGDTVTFHVNASDVDGDALSYAWTATSGAFIGTPPDGAVDNTWSSGGAAATITVVVTDARGATASHDFVIEAGWFEGYGSSGTDEVTHVAANATRILVSIQEGGAYTIHGSGTGVAGAMGLYMLDLDGSVIWGWEYPAGTVITDLAIDSNGFGYVVGRFSGDMSVGHDSAGHDVIAHQPGANNDMFVVSYGPDRLVSWLNTYGGPANDDGGALEVDHPHNRLYVSGIQGGGPINLGSGLRSTPLTGVDAFVIALTADGGTHQWDHELGVSGSGAGSLGASLAVVPGTSDLIVAAGVYGGGTVQPFGSGVTYSAASTGSDAIVMRVDWDGNLQWLAGYSNVHTGGVGYVFSNDVTADASGNAYVAIAFEGGLRRQPYLGGRSYTSQGSYDSGVVTLDASGNEVWTMQIGGDHGEYTNVSSASDGTLWVGGTYTENAHGYIDAAVETLFTPPTSPTRYDGYVLHLGTPTTDPHILEVTAMTNATGGNALVDDLALMDAMHPIVVGWTDSPGFRAEGTTLGYAGGATDGFAWLHQAAIH